MLAGMVAFLTTLRASCRKQPEAIQTTLYDLVAALQDEIGHDQVGPDHDALIVDTVTGLIRTGQLRFLNDIEPQRAER